MVTTTYVLVAVLLILRSPEVKGQAPTGPTSRPRTGVGAYFEFSPELKVRQCNRTVDLFQRCNVSQMFYSIPEIDFHNTRLVKEVDIYFQVIVYLEAPNVTYPSIDLLPFCRYGFCVACLLKSGFRCRSPQTNTACLANLTNGNVASFNDLCLTRECVQSSSVCRIQDQVVESRPRQNTNCTNVSYQGTACYYVNSTTRSRLLSTGGLVDGESCQKLDIAVVTFLFLHKSLVFWL